MARKISIPNLDDLLRRYISGDSELQLSQGAGINRWTFRQRLLEAGITPRTQSEAEIIKWNRMTAEQRTCQVKAAHNAVRSRKVSFKELCLRAKTREGNLQYNVSPNEIVLGQWLNKSGFDIIHNLAIGPYNCDIGIGAVTVEVWGGDWHPKLIEIKRTKYILDCGYSILIVNLNQGRFPLSPAVTNYVITLIQETSSNPTGGRQYWMVRGDGELIFKRFNDDNISLIPPFTSARDLTNGKYKRVPR